MTNNLQDKWNKSSQTISSNKQPSSYAINAESLTPTDSIVLDIGGGTGVDASYFLSKGHAVTLLDISDQALRTAVAKAPNLITVQADLSEGNLPFADESFDVIYSRLALHYFKQDRMIELFGEINRILKPAGRVFITIKSAYDQEELLHLQKTAQEIEPNIFDDNGQTKTRFTTEQLEDMLQNAGIQDYEITRYEESFIEKNDSIKSGKEYLLLSELQWTK